MRNFDLTPLYRSGIGFDRLTNVLETLSRNEQSQPSYPPYNIELTGEDQYRISMAAAGFSDDEITINVDQNKLTISGKKVTKEDKKQFLHQGIAERNFERRFQLEDYVRVDGATMENGLLHIDLVRELPETMKPRNIAINRVQQRRVEAA